MSTNTSVQFFDEQFKRQLAAADYVLNPFEVAALPYLSGEVLDFGCGLGNLALEAARCGCTVTALDASHAAISHIEAVAREANLPIEAAEADLREYRIANDYDSIVCIGLLMFFDCPTAYRKLEEIQARVRQGGIAVVNVLTEGTDFTEMFSPEGHCLFKVNELAQRFRAWEVLMNKSETFPAPGNRQKVFTTVIARKPQAWPH